MSKSESESELDPEHGPGRAPQHDADPTTGPGRPLKATALSYERGERAPRIVASGSGEVAKRIIELAEEAGVPVRSDPALAAALDALKIEAEIPPDLYKAVAEALAWAYKVDGTIAEQRRQNRH